jgi:hypothetical protein
MAAQRAGRAHPQRQCEDLTYVSCVERGLMLMKVAAEPGQRREILDLASIFRAAVVDVSERSMMLSVTGDPGKTRAFQLAMSKFGVVAVARTGKLALRRELAYNKERRERLSAAARAREAPPSPDDRPETPTGSRASVDVVAGAVSGGDVYKLEAADLTGVWDAAVPPVIVSLRHNSVTFVMPPFEGTVRATLGVTRPGGTGTVPGAPTGVFFPAAPPDAVNRSRQSPPRFSGE